MLAWSVGSSWWGCASTIVSSSAAPTPMDDDDESVADRVIYAAAKGFPRVGEQVQFYARDSDDESTGEWFAGSCVFHKGNRCKFIYDAAEHKDKMHELCKLDPDALSEIRVRVGGPTSDGTHVGPLTARVARAARATYDEPPADVESDEFFTRVLDLGLPGRLLDAVLLIGTLLTAPLWRMRFFAHLGHWLAGGMELESAAIQRALRTIESTWEAEAYLLPPKPGHIANYRWPKKVCGRFWLDKDALANLQTVLLRGIDFAGALARLKARAVAGDVAADILPCVAGEAL